MQFLFVLRQVQDTWPDSTLKALNTNITQRCAQCSQVCILKLCFQFKYQNLPQYQHATFLNKPENYFVWTTSEFPRQMHVLRRLNNLGLTTQTMKQLWTWIQNHRTQKVVLWQRALARQHIQTIASQFKFLQETLLNLVFLSTSLNLYLSSDLYLQLEVDK